MNAAAVATIESNNDVAKAVNKPHPHNKQTQQFSNRPHQHQQQRKRKGQYQRQRQRKNDATTPKECCSVCQTGAPNYKCPKCRAIYCCIACCRIHKEQQCTITSKDTSTTIVESNSDVLACKKSKYLSKQEIVQFAKEIQDNQNCSASNRIRRRSSNNRIIGDDVDDDNNDEQHDDDFLEEGWKITDAMKQSLQESDWLQKELCNDEGLRLLISKITTASSIVMKQQRRTLTSNCTEQEALLDSYQANNPEFRTFLDKILVLSGAAKVVHDNDNDTDGTSTQDRWINTTTAETAAATGVTVVMKSISTTNQQQRTNISSSTTSSDSTSSSSEEE